MAAISLTTGTTYTQNFDTLASAGTSSTLPNGWEILEVGTSGNVNGQYTAGTGSSNSGDTYSFGASGSPERALGGLQSGTLNPKIGASFINDTGSTITALNIGFTGEQWRLGALNRSDRLDFQYSLDASSLTTGTWTDVNALDFTAPTTTGTVGALDGNAVANSTAIANSIAGLSIPAGATVWIRWTDVNASGADDGLAIDNFSITPITGASPAADVTIESSFLNKVGSATSTTASEIPAFDPASKKLYVVASSKVDIYSVSNNGELAITSGDNGLDPGFPIPTGTVVAPNSVSIQNGLVAVAFDIRDTAPPNTIRRGRVSFYRASDDAFLSSVEIGFLPDMLTFTPDGTKILVANEGEPNEDYSDDPEGSVSVITIDSLNLAGGTISTTVQEAGFTSFNSQFAELKAAGVRLIGPVGTTVAQDVEPEYIAVSADGKTAAITLQENNAIAFLDIATATITDIKPLGLKDHSLAGNGLDVSDRDVDGTSGGGGKINIQNWPVFGMYQPDAIASFVSGGNTFYIIANEGDARVRPTADGIIAGQDEGDIYNEEVRVGSGSYVLAPDVFSNAAELKLTQNLGRLTVSNKSGDIDNDGQFEQIHAFGGRSFAILDSNGNIVFDSGDQFEQIIAKVAPATFNGDPNSSGNLQLDSRSDNKGPEPEGVTTGVINGRTYAFIGLERVGDVIVYEVTNPTAPKFVQYINTPEDRRVEGLIFVSATDSPTGNPLLITAAEGSNTVAVFSVNVGTRISDIQGSGHISPLVGQVVSGVAGIVTAVDSNGFYLQDPTPDADEATSEGIFVFTSSAPTVQVGDSVKVNGTVSEFTPGGASSGNLSITQISGSPTVTILSSGNPLPAAIILGNGGRVPPTQVIEDDAFGSFDPSTDGIDFYEALEGMRVTIQDAVAVSPTNRFGEIFALANQGAGATGLSDRGTINISPTDFNPERIQIDDSNVSPGATPLVKVGDRLGDVTGVVSYNFGNYEVQFTQAFTPVSGGLEPETTNLTKSSNKLTVASYNVLNLDPNDADGDADIANGRFTAIAQQIVNNLASPDIISLQEVQDNSGSANNGVTAADVTLQTLINAIVAAGGETYEFIDNSFIANNASGGQPGGNIRNAYLYNPSRVSLVEGSVEAITGDAFVGSRLPLVASFTFNGETVTLVNNHFSSKGGSSPLFGANQPSVGDEANGNGQENTNINGSLNERQAQAKAVKDYVDSMIALDANANVVVLGDFNEFEFISPLSEILTGGTTPVLTNLTNTLPEDERYSFIFEGNSQSLDHILTSNGLAAKAEFDVVHVNTEFPDTAARASDHDPIVARFNLTTVPNVPANFSMQILHGADFEAGVSDLNNILGFSAIVNKFKTATDLPANVVANTLILSAGDNYIPGAFFNASTDTSLNGVGGLGTSGAPVSGRGDIGILNAIGVQASALGNHEFDLGLNQVASIIRTGSGNPGTAFPYLSSNLDFSPETGSGRSFAATDFSTNPVAEASTIKGKIAESTVITVAGIDGILGTADDQKIGIVGATTPILPTISSSGATIVTPGNPNDFAALAAEIQKTVDLLTAQGINKIVLLSHFQQFAIESEEIAPRLKDVDILIGGGSNTRLLDDNDVLRAGDTDQGDYPILRFGTDGKPILVVNTDGNYKYVGRLVTEFDNDGVLLVDKLDSTINGAYATDAAGVNRVYGETVVAREKANANVVAIVDGISNVIASKDNVILGKTSVFLNGTRGDVRTQETNLGNLTADANLALAKQIDPTVTISIKNGGGIRDNIGALAVPTGATGADDVITLPPQPNPLAPNKEEGDISQLDLENSLRFNNGLTLITLTAQQLLWVIEHAVAGTRSGATPGQFPQVSGLSFSFDPTQQAIAFDTATGVITQEGQRVQSLAVLNEDGSLLDVIVKDGVLVGDVNRTFRTVTLNFLAGSNPANALGGDRYPFPSFVQQNAALANRVDLRGETADVNLNGVIDPAPDLPAGKFIFAPTGSEQDALAEYLGDRFDVVPFNAADVKPAQDTRIQNLSVRNDSVFNATGVTQSTPGVIEFTGGSGITQIEFNITKVNSSTVNELVVFEVDGSGTTPDLKLLLENNRARVISSVISDRPDGFGFDEDSRTLGFAPNAKLGFAIIKNGTADDILFDKPREIVFSTTTTTLISDVIPSGFRINFEGFEIDATASTSSRAVGSGLQDNNQGEVLDLRSLSGDVNVNFTVFREAAFNNTVGFYRVANTDGGIDVDGDGIIDFTPGQSGYARAAIENRIKSIDLSVANQGTAIFDDKVLTGGSIFAPFIISDGTADQFLSGQVSQAYFAYLEANPDNVDHIRLLGDNTFGFEDLPGGGDFDYNDIVLKVDVSANKVITGDDGDNILRGGFGNDTLIGGLGADTLVGGFGNDTLFLGLNDGATDTVVYSLGDGSDVLNQFLPGLGGDLLQFNNIAAIDVSTVGGNTQFLLGDGVTGNVGFASGSLLLTLNGVTGFTSSNINDNILAGSIPTTFNFS
ncbi:choice-of-anchor I family protein [Pseudanabaena galeata UHCC 0370]|uniref:Choice-of-anchor I family protein n=1 Tax=Pseudanabaena galeata UHCC 0370 TaxID=3110310 RepID=A0ABU5TI63_9CYAN|nr:choice-of-anchor I family protein [Pseudanabaena galeata]MEA5477924.1 choice-of-anchor I family protein [Pseudanabaena galeata UHCC 0370]